jgi:hypothetical protein
VKSAFRLLADSGFGGERSRGWGRAAEPGFSDASHLFGRSGATDRKDGLWWLLSLYSPHETDAVDWSHGEYSAQVRGGWTDSVAGAGPKKQVRMITEGSVLSAIGLRGQVVDVAPDGFPHPVYRSGFALAIPAPTEIVVRAAEASRPQRVVPEAVVTEEVAELVAVPEEDAASVRVSDEEPVAEAAVPAVTVAREESTELPAVQEESVADSESAAVMAAPEASAELPAVPEEDAASVHVSHEQPTAEPVEVAGEEPPVTPKDEEVSE